MSASGWFPTSTPMPLPEAKTQDAIKPRLIILHSQAGVGSLFGFWLRGSNLESHFWVALNGESEQYMPCDVQADANLRANDFAISVETENHARYAHDENWDGDPWTAEQIEELAQICAEGHRRYGIPLELAKTWDGSGIGYHIQFGAPGPWTPVAKACPGATRIKQVKQVIARARELVEEKVEPVGIGPKSSVAAVEFFQVILNLNGQEVPIDGKFGTEDGQAVRNLKAFFNAKKIGFGKQGFDLSKERGWIAGPQFLSTLAAWTNFLHAQGVF